jgi:ferritin-like metal-binding protein YciE
MVSFYHSTLRAAHHVVNNFLNQVQLFQFEAERLPDFDPELRVLYGQVLEETAAQLRQLERVTELTEENILNAAMQPRSAEAGG